ncbi:MAG: serine/threonine protein kinase [Sandaracinaceae bacterium]|nr:serine/threonine protein kinase [Sandaracinaceae bacterium]
MHRDVSPQNVLLSNEGAVKVSDFGLVKAADNVVQTGSGVPIGKLSYMAPEQAEHVPVDARADVFSLGIVVWEMLTMRTLMPPNDPARASAMLQACQFKPPSAYNPKVPPALDEIVMRCLTKSAEQRTPSAQALSMQLREVLDELAPGYGRDQLARLLGWAFPEKGWSIDEPHETAAQPSVAERMSMMPQVPAADAMQRAAEAAAQSAATTGRHSAQPQAAAPYVTGGHPALPGPHTTGGHPAMQGPVATGGHPMPPAAAPVATASTVPAAPRRSSAGTWIVILAIGGVLALAVLVVLVAIAFLFVRAGAEEAEERAAVAPAPSVAPAAAVWIDTNVSGARVFVGEHEIGVAPVRLDASRLTGQPLVVIAPGHQPALMPAHELSTAMTDGRGRQLVALVPTPRPHRVVLVRHPRPASARVAFTNQPLGAVPGVIVVPPLAMGDLAPHIEIVEPGYPALRMSTAGCDPTTVCVLDGGAL